MTHPYTSAVRTTYVRCATETMAMARRESGEDLWTRSPLAHSTRSLMHGRSVPVNEILHILYKEARRSRRRCCRQLLHRGLNKKRCHLLSLSHPSGARPAGGAAHQSQVGIQCTEHPTISPTVAADPPCICPDDPAVRAPLLLPSCEHVRQRL